MKPGLFGHEALESQPTSRDIRDFKKEFKSRIHG
jgi:hypothetical protein